MLKIFQKDTAFFDIFEQAAANVHEGARQLLALMEDYRNVADHASSIKDLEHRNDLLTHRTIDQLNKSFITPFDREDIHDIISRLDDVLDLMEAAVGRMSLFRIERTTDDARKLAEVLVRSTALIAEAMKALRAERLPDVLRIAVDIHTQENEGDTIHRHALAALFANSMGAVDIIKWKDVYEKLEFATDRCEDVANGLEAICVKNA